MKTLRMFPFTAATLLLAAAVVLCTQLFDLDLFEHVLGFLAFVEQYEIDELFLPGLVVLIGLLIDLKVAKEREGRIAAKKVRELKALHADLLRFRAQAITQLTPQSVAQLDEIIHDASTL
jgi:hypothetical protein